MSTQTPIRIAVVGVGKIARDQHLPAIRDSPDFELAALISRSACNVDVPVFASLDAAFAAGTPPTGHWAACRSQQHRETASGYSRRGENLEATRQ